MPILHQRRVLKLFGYQPNQHAATCLRLLHEALAAAIQGANERGDGVEQTCHELADESSLIRFAISELETSFRAMRQVERDPSRMDEAEWRAAVVAEYIETRRRSDREYGAAA